MIKKLHYSLANIASEWTHVTNQNISVIDILELGEFSLLPATLISQGYSVSLADEISHPYLPIYGFINRANFVVDSNGIVIRYFGRFLLDPYEVTQIKKYGEVEVVNATDVDIGLVFKFVDSQTITINELVITHQAKIKFEDIYLSKFFDARSSK